MKLNDKYKEMFKSLNQSTLGKTMVEYLEDLMTHICDARNWGDNDSKESTQHVASIIQSELVDKIQLQNKPKKIAHNDYH